MRWLLYKPILALRLIAVKLFPLSTKPKIIYGVKMYNVFENALLFLLQYKFVKLLQMLHFS